MPPATRVRVRIGEIFRVRYGEQDRSASPLRTYQELTRGEHETCADIQKGIWAYKPVRLSSGLLRIPAVVLHSNPFKEGSEIAPWVDTIEPESGYSLFHGDNRRSTTRPIDSRGNRLLLHVYQACTDRSARVSTPPILLFNQKDVQGNRKGFRQFAGFGVPSRLTLVSQREKGSDRFFTNVLAELVLFRLDDESELFDWGWIDRRRDPNVSDEQALQYAPSAWKLWVEQGAAALERCRRRVTRHVSSPPSSQLTMSDSDMAVLRAVEEYFQDRKHHFEGLAALITERVLGTACIRGWVTKKSGDRGIDFVNRLVLGSGSSSVRVVVLGQAKCQRQVSGLDLARLVARLQRGWIGAFVTTGAFSRDCQQELSDDKYPVALIGGARVANELRLVMNATGVTLAELLEEERQWYESHLRFDHPERVLDDDLFGTAVPAQPVTSPKDALPLPSLDHGLRAKLIRDSS